LKQDAAKRNANVASARAQVTQSQAKTDPIRFWDAYYASEKSNDDPEDVLGLVALLRIDSKFRDIEGVLRGYLRHHSDLAEVWMYDTLGLAIEMNKGDIEEVKTLIGFAAHLAKDSDNPNDLFQVADMLILRKWVTPVGTDGYKANPAEILDRLIKRVPHRLEPYLMSILLAEESKNPARMAEAAEGILSLGWPGQDEGVRRELRARTEAFARKLRDEGRGDEARAMQDRVSKATVRDLVVKLKWKGIADLDLAVDEPLGAQASYEMPRTVFGGSLISNGRSTSATKLAEETYVCPRGFDGEYVINVKTIYNSPEDLKQMVRTAELEVITHEGTSQEKKQIFSIDLTQARPASVKVRLDDGQRLVALPFIGPQRPPELPKNLQKAIAKSEKTKSDNSKVIGAGGSRQTSPENQKSKAIVVPEYQPKSTKAIDLTNPK
jgi:hypothetical protein